MKRNQGCLLIVAIAVAVWMVANAAFAQSNTQTLHGTPTVKVDCNKKGSINAALASLSKTGMTRGVTISVTGTCKENITIGGFDHLVLQGLPTATLQDASNGTAVVATIYNSYDVTLQGFTINGGLGGVVCAQDSFCSLYLNTIQQSSGDGVSVGRSNVLLQNNNILNHGGQGINLHNGSTVRSISDRIGSNGASGIAVISGSNLYAESDSIQNNGAAGIRALGNSVVRAFDLNIAGNSGNGVRLDSASTASFAQLDTGNAITSNGGHGVEVHDLSFAGFNGANVSGNLAQPDVACYPQFSATRGAGTVGGTTNCKEP